MFNLGFSELILIAIIALIFIGPKQLPELARTLGRALNELKRATGDITSAISNPSRFIENPDEKETVISRPPSTDTPEPIADLPSPIVDLPPHAPLGEDQVSMDDPKKDPKNS